MHLFVIFILSGVGAAVCLGPGLVRQLVILVTSIDAAGFLCCLVTPAPPHGKPHRTVHFHSELSCIVCFQFKTGLNRFGGESMFHVQRASNNICLGLAKVLLGCATLGGASSVGNSNPIKVLQGVNKSPLGSVINSKQWSHCFPFVRNRFNAKAKPVYDVLNADGEIRFSIVVPVKQGKFLGCITAFYEEDFLAIVPGPLTAERYNHCSPCICLICSADNPCIAFAEKSLPLCHSAHPWHPRKWNPLDPSNTLLAPSVLALDATDPRNDLACHAQEPRSRAPWGRVVH